MNAGSGSTSPSGDRDLLVLCPPVGPSMRTECQHIPADWKRTPILEDRREPVSLGWTGRAGGVDLRITTERRLQSVSSAGKACEFLTAVQLRVVRRALPCPALETLQVRRCTLPLPPICRCTASELESWRSGRLGCSSDRHQQRQRVGDRELTAQHPEHIRVSRGVARAVAPLITLPSIVQSKPSNGNAVQPGCAPAQFAQASLPHTWGLPDIALPN